MLDEKNIMKLLNEQDENIKAAITANLHNPLEYSLLTLSRTILWAATIIAFKDRIKYYENYENN